MGGRCCTEVFVFMQEQKAQGEGLHEALPAAQFSILLQLLDGQFVIQDE